MVTYSILIFSESFASSNNLFVLLMVTLMLCLLPVGVFSPYVADSSNPRTVNLSAFSLSR